MVASKLNPVSKLIIYGVLIIIAAFWTIPTLGLLMTSIRTPDDASATGWWTFFAPGNGGATLQNYAEIFGIGGAGTDGNNASSTNIN